MNRDELGRRIIAVARRQGRHDLRGGGVTDIYYYKYGFESYPDILREIARLMARQVPADTQVLAGIVMGGIPLVTALSLKCGLPSVYIRDVRK